MDYVGHTVQSEHACCICYFMILPQQMLTQLRAIFDLIIQFQNAQDSFFSAATTELQSRQRLEKAVEHRTDEVSVYCFWM